MAESPIEIDSRIRRQFTLGRQGLWPGRRWSGRAGLIAALDTIGAVQMDPLQVVARSHDMVLWGRVAGYRPADLDVVMYEERRFFDYGGVLCIHPMTTLPHWRHHMERRKAEPRLARFAAEQAAVIQRVRDDLRTRGPLGNRDFAGNAREGSLSYRGGKDTSIALYYLWMTGEVMIHHRDGFTRIYDLRERIAPAAAAAPSSPEVAEAFFAQRAVAVHGIAGQRDWKNAFAGFMQTRSSLPEARQRLAAMVEAGAIVPVHVDGERGVSYAIAEEAGTLRTIAQGVLPDTWQPLSGARTTEDEAIVLAPLDPVVRGGAAQKLFGFEYLWEVYKPAAKRRWGYYTVPILWGDELVARLDPAFDRATKALRLLGLWLEDDALAANPAFISALANGLRSFGDVLGADSVDLTPIAGHPIVNDLRLLLADR